MRKQLLMLAVLLACVGITTAQSLMTVAEARYDGDSDGIPDLLGQVVSIVAVATCEGNTFSTSGSSLSFYVQDTTAGINVYSYTEYEPPGGVQAGDSLSITGEIAIYNGLTEIKPTIQMVELGVTTVPDPLQMYRHQGVTESIEGLLLVFGNESAGEWVTVATVPESSGGGYNFEVWNGQTVVAIRVNESTGINISGVQPGDKYFITGIGGQYDSEEPYNSGYQLLPRYQTDLVPFFPDIGSYFHLDIKGSPSDPSSPGNPFAPCLGELTYIEYGGSSGMTFTLTVFDRAGREVAHLVESRSGGDVMEWNGHDDNDEILSMGPYILLLEGIDGSGDRKTTTETVVIASPME